MKNLKKIKGALTLEAAIVLPIFICAIVSVAFFTKVIYVHEIMQQAINEVATNMAQTSYVLYAAGINHHDVKDGTQVILESVDAMVFPENQQDTDAEKFQQTLFDEVLHDSAYEVVIEEIQNYFRGNINDEILLQQSLQLITKILVKNQLKTMQADVDKRLKALHIVDGYQGLDFTKSRFFTKDTEDIDIVLMYQVKLPLPFNVLPDIHIAQRAVTRAWLDGAKETVQGEEKIDIWALDRWERGRHIQQMQPYKRNVPDNFPTITRFENGVASKVRSINLNDVSYQNNSQVRSQINAEIRKLDGFEGAKRSGVSIQKEDISAKEVIIVFPKGTIRESLVDTLEQCKEYAAQRGIALRIDEL